MGGAEVAIVCAGGGLPNALVGRRLPAAGLVVAADSGLDTALHIGLHVDLVVGDLDSVSQEALALACAAGAVAQNGVADAAVPTLVLRGYLATGSADLAEALGVALAQALDLAVADTTTLGRAAWLTLLVEASIVADDERLRPAAAAAWEWTCKVHGSRPFGQGQNMGEAHVRLPLCVIIPL